MRYGKVLRDNAFYRNFCLRFRYGYVPKPQKIPIIASNCFAPI